jgi:DNA-binding GntR family transcriptional regulator
MPNLNARVVPLRVVPLRRETLQNGVYSGLCDLILQGGLAPGEQMTVASIAKVFGVSPMPVREALTRLSAADALTVISGRTVGVPPLTRERLDDLRRVRLELEPIAAEWAAEKREPKFLDELQERLVRLRATEAAGNAKLYIKENYGFHISVYRQSQSPTLISIIEGLWLQVSPYLHLLRESKNFNISNLHHKLLFDALAKGDQTGARLAVRNDIDDAYETLTQLI